MLENLVEFLLMWPFVYVASIICGKAMDSKHAIIYVPAFLIAGTVILGAIFCAITQILF